MQLTAIQTSARIAGCLTCAAFLVFGAATFAGTVNVGSGSYTATFPGVDQENRNSYPGGTPHNYYRVISVQ